LCSGIGISTFITLIGLLIPQNTISSALSEEEQLKRQKENDESIKVIRVFSKICLVLLILLMIVHYCGFANIEDVFNGKYKYVGQTVNNKADGYGFKYSLEDDLIYEGNFESNYYEGQGTLYTVVQKTNGEKASLKVYEGNFKNGSYDGEGKQYYDYIDPEHEDYYLKYPRLLYDGEFCDGLFHGTGTYYSYFSAEEATPGTEPGVSFEYTGDWKFGEKNGHGVLTVFDVNGNKVERYDGYFSNGQYNGQGIWEFTDKSDNNYGNVVYNGIIENGRFNGPGVYYRQDGSVITSDTGYNDDIENLMQQYPFPESTIWD